MEHLSTQVAEVLRLPEDDKARQVATDSPNPDDVRGECDLAWVLSRILPVLYLFWLNGLHFQAGTADLHSFHVDANKPKTSTSLVSN